MCRACTLERTVLLCHVPNPECRHDDAEEKYIRLVGGEECGKSTHPQDRKEWDQVVQTAHKHGRARHTARGDYNDPPSMLPVEMHRSKEPNLSPKPNKERGDKVPPVSHETNGGAEVLHPKNLYHIEHHRYGKPSRQAPKEDRETRREDHSPSKINSVPATGESFNDPLDPLAKTTSTST